MVNGSLFPPPSGNVSAILASATDMMMSASSPASPSSRTRSTSHRRTAERQDPPSRCSIQATPPVLGGGAPQQDPERRMTALQAAERVLAVQQDVERPSAPAWTVCGISTRGQDHVLVVATEDQDEVLVRLGGPVGLEAVDIMHSAPVQGCQGQGIRSAGASARTRIPVAAARPLRTTMARRPSSHAA